MFGDEVAFVVPPAVSQWNEFDHLHGIVVVWNKCIRLSEESVSQLWLL